MPAATHADEYALLFFLPDKAQHPIPYVRAQLSEDIQVDKDSFLRGCSGVLISFSRCRDVKQDGSLTDLNMERFTIRCVNSRKNNERSDEEQPWLTLCPLFTQDEAESFRHHVVTAGLWWLELRFSDNREALLLTVDTAGEIVSRHVMPTSETVITIPSDNGHSH